MARKKREETTYLHPNAVHLERLLAVEEEPAVDAELEELETERRRRCCRCFCCCFCCCSCCCKFGRGGGRVERKAFEGERCPSLLRGRAEEGDQLVCEGRISSVLRWREKGD